MCVFFTDLFINEHLDHFHNSVIMNNAAICMGVYISLWDNIAIYVMVIVL